VDVGASSGSTGSTVMPQLTESFLDRLLEMSQESDDLEFRQDLTKRIMNEGVNVAHLTRQAQYYDSMRRAFAGGRSATSTAVATEVRTALDRAFEEISTGLDQVGELYARIAEQHLNPSGVLFSVTSPFSIRTVPSLPVNTAVRYLAAALFMGVFLIPLACLAHAYVRDSVTSSRVREKEKQLI
jgi:hypothetical protein